MDKRTNPQNNSMHLFFTDTAEQLNDAGLEMKKVFEIKEVDVPWTQLTVKEVIWKPIQKTMTGKNSTAELTKEEVNLIYKVVHRLFAERFGLNLTFPSKEE